jgi:2-methylisocitrate lyase-like PEP mutase family enzyme
VFAPGVVDPGRIRRLVMAVEVPVNVIANRDGPPISELRALGVRRVSTGGSLARAAYGALLSAARELRDGGTSTYLDGVVTWRELQEAFRDGGAD